MRKRMTTFKREWVNNSHINKISDKQHVESRGVREHNQYSHSSHSYLSIPIPIPILILAYLYFYSRSHLHSATSSHSLPNHSG